MKLSFSGGAMEIGGSCIYINIDQKGILFDSGIRQSAAKDPIPDFRIIQELGGVDIIIVSHAHMDHTGTLPMISKAYPQARIYMTPMTADLVRVLLFDSLKIMDRREDELPHYAQQEVTAMLNRIYPLGFQIPFSIAPGLTLTFYPAGHIAGAACVYVTGNEGTVFYSGDFCSFLQKTIEGMRIPKLRPDVAIVETTYGNRLHANRQVEEQRLIQLVAEEVKAGHKILIPTFALGRAQEVLLLLKSALQNQQIPSVPVYVDGMVREINRMYEKNPTFLRNNLAKSILKGHAPFYTEEITPVAPSQNREELLARKGAAVFVSSSGMLTGGPSLFYAQKIAPMEDGCIIITGYQDEEAPGRKLMNLLEAKKAEEPENPESPSEPSSAPKLLLDGLSVPVRCKVAQVGLSAHGDQNEISSLIDHLSPRDIFLVHGDKEVIRAFASNLALSYKQHLYLPECGNSYDLNVQNKRKQLSFSLPFTMKCKEAPEEAEESLLWNYVRTHYPEKELTCAQLAFIWSGKSSHEPDSLEKLQTRLLKSAYFSPNSHRLFLFHANTEEEVKENLAPKVKTNQEIEAAIREYFPTLPYKKIGYYPASQKAVLTFDYPDAVDSNLFLTQAREFTRASGWDVEISPSMNFTAATLLIGTLLGDCNLKISYFTERKIFTVQFNNSTDALSAITDETRQKAAQTFKETTGWQLLSPSGQPLVPVPDAVNPAFSHRQSFGKSIDSLTEAGNERENPTEKKKLFIPDKKTSPQPLEQNMALYCTEQTFSDSPHHIYKKSIKNDAEGKYLELAFITPEVGLRHQEHLSDLANQIGWRIKLSDSVNQNELFKQAHILCAKYGLALKQNPSYLPARRSIQIKLCAEISREIQEQVQKDFLDATGLALLL